MVRTFQRFVIQRMTVAGLFFRFKNAWEWETKIWKNEKSVIFSSARCHRLSCHYSNQNGTPKPPIKPIIQHGAVNKRNKKVV
jgi:hypothetical protein